MFKGVKNLHKKIDVRMHPKTTTIIIEGKRTFMGVIDSWILDGFDIKTHKSYDNKNTYFINMKTEDYTKKYSNSTTPQEYFNNLMFPR